MKPLEKELERCAIETRKLDINSRGLASIGDRIAEHARVKADRARVRIANARTDQERMAAEGDYAQALQDVHIATTCASAALRRGKQANT